MKKLLITSDTFLPRLDGISRFLQELIPYLSKHYQITIVAPKFSGLFPQVKAKLVQIPLSDIHAGDLQLAKYDPKTIKKLISQADIIFNQSLGPIGYLAVKLAAKRKKPVISYIHSLDWELFSNSLKYFPKCLLFLVKLYVKKCYNKCNCLIVPSTTVAQELEKIGVKTKKQVVALGVNLKAFFPSRNKAASKRKLGLKQKEIVIGYIGRIAREKNLIILKRAFEKINKKFPNTKLIIIGEGLQEQKEMLKGDNVILEGKRKNVVPFYQAMDIFVLTSLTETSSLATMEAMACGIPPVVTPVGHLRDYIKDGENGLFFPDEDSLVEKLTFLIKNKKRREEIGKKARQTAVKEFSWSETAKKITSHL